jgi:hypothetical protein
LTTEFEFGYFTSAVISAQKNADFPVKVSPHRSFDLFNQICSYCLPATNCVCDFGTSRLENANIFLTFSLTYAK